MGKRVTRISNELSENVTLFTCQDPPEYSHVMVAASQPAATGNRDRFRLVLDDESLVRAPSIRAEWWRKLSQLARSGR